MRSEAALTRINTEIRPNRSVAASNVVYPDFKARNGRMGIVAIGGITVTAESVIQERGSNVVDFPRAIRPEIAPIEVIKKSEVYNPSKRSRQYVDETGRLVIRRKRPSRCNGSHDVEADPCGSPRCRSQAGRPKLAANSSGGTKGETIKPKKRKPRVIIGGTRS